MLLAFKCFYELTFAYSTFGVVWMYINYVWL